MHQKHEKYIIGKQEDNHFLDFEKRFVLEGDTDDPFLYMNRKEENILKKEKQTEHEKENDVSGNRKKGINDDGHKNVKED